MGDLVSDQPDWHKTLAEAGAALREGLEQSGRILTAQGAISATQY
jgi:hypothetical protein